MVILTELRGGTAFPLLEDAVEVAQVVETALETDLGNALRRVHQHTAGIAQSLLDDILAEVASGMELE